MIRQAVVRVLARLLGWTIVGTPPRRGIFVGAPHTSNWDYVLTLMTVWNAGLTPRILVKKELFRGPLGWVLKLTGSLPVDRRKPGDLIARLAHESRGDRPFVLVLAAEGTRQKTEYWKSGFYRLSQQTGLPIILGFVDGANKRAGIGPSFTPSGDVRADMDFVREFYADKHGIKPELRGEPRLREETRDASPQEGEPGA
jgi:1-acyl-sn-glycerol-3-phosphate acyltransferase